MKSSWHGKELDGRVDSGSLSCAAGLQLPQLAAACSLPLALWRLTSGDSIQARERPCACSLARLTLPAYRPAGRPVVERVACWSARHRKTAVGAWLAFMAAAFIVGQFAAGNGVQQYDPGQAGRGEQVLTNLGVVTPPAESVLIEARTGEGHLAAAAARDVRDAAAEVKRVTLQVEAALAALPQAADNIRAPFQPGAADWWPADGTAALVTFNVAGPNADADTTVLTDLAVVRKIQAAHPNLLVREAGEASTDRVASAVLGQDFRQSEWTSIPLTLILLLAVFGALIAAGIPVRAGRDGGRHCGLATRASPAGGCPSARAPRSWCS